MMIWPGGGYPGFYAWVLLSPGSAVKYFDFEASVTRGIARDVHVDRSWFGSARVLLGFTLDVSAER